MTMRQMVISMVLGGATLLSAARGFAGQKYSPDFTCWKEADGSGGCQGTMQTARADSDKKAEVAFIVNAAGDHQFYAADRDGTRACFAEEGSKVANMFALAIANRGLFYVTWDAFGQCTQLSVTHGSAYSTF
jgi:hypothetical protein